MSADEAQQTFVDLALENLRIEIHPIVLLHFQVNALLKNLGRALWQGYRRFRLKAGL